MKFAAVNEIMNCQFVKCIDNFDCQICRHSLIKVYKNKDKTKRWLDRWTLDFISVCCEGDLLCQ